ncbi:MAG: hypothetical protein ACM3UO_00245 [Bacillota bacterium]
MTEIDLAAVNKHHVPGTAYHWKHGYIPLDARTAALWGKKDHEARLIREGHITTHEPDGRHRETDAKPSRATHSLEIHDVSDKREKAKAVIKASGDDKAARTAARDYVEAFRKYKVAMKEPNPILRRAASRPAKARLGEALDEVRKHHADLGNPGHEPSYEDGPKDLLAVAKQHKEWRLAHEANIEMLAKHYGKEHPAGAPHDNRSLTSLRSHINKGLSGSTSRAPRKKAEAAPERSSIDKVMEPKEGDTLPSPGGNPNSRFIQKNGEWRIQLRAGESSRWALSGMAAIDNETMRHGSKAMLGLDPKEYDARLAKHLEQSSALSRNRARAMLGTDEAHGFKPIGFAEAGLTRDNGTNIYRHADGTEIHIQKGVNATPEQLQKFAANVAETTRIVGPTHAASGHNEPVKYKVDLKNHGGTSWDSHMGSTGAYVISSDEEGKNTVHVNPENVTGRSATTNRVGTGHSMPGAANVNGAVYTLVHENGHIHHNRNGNVSFRDLRGGDGKRLGEDVIKAYSDRLGSHIGDRSLLDFHREAYSDVPGGYARYARTNNAEGYAEAWSQHHLGNLGDASSQLPEHDMVTEVAKKYAQKFGWKAQNAKGAKTA